eukprot:4352181-Heterocapsa_arctica.AAC.1
MVEDRQRQVSSFEELVDSQAKHIPELPVIVVNPEVASGSGDLSAIISKAVAIAVKQHMAKP